MQSELLKTIGLDKIDPAYFVIALLVICIGLLVYIISVNKKLNQLNEKYKKFMGGKDGKTLEHLIEKRFSQVDDLIQCDKKTNEKIKEINENFLIAFQKIGIVKYDAFNEMGGKLSFALALLNQENTGFVINAMHSREGCYTYIKEIIKGESYILLGDEEQEAVEKAVNCDNYME